MRFIPRNQGKIMSDAYPCYQNILISDQVSGLLQFIIDRGGSFSLFFIQGKNRDNRNQFFDLLQSFFTDNTGIQLK